MPPQRLYARPGVISNAGRVALKRGLLVYCVEEVDNPGGRVTTGAGRLVRRCFASDHRQAT
ncbi:hypothetical protein [Devosia rhizosphaerae]|uniref:hypothetical protein n=1 Tax=Devosia rhizosphaerae TaxID=3049774 RepID=UPI0039F601E1